LKKFNQIKLF